MDKWGKVIQAEADKRAALQQQNDALVKQVAALQSQVDAQQVQVNSLTSTNTSLQQQVDALTASQPDADDNAVLATEEAALNLDADGNPVTAAPVTTDTGATGTVDSTATGTVSTDTSSAPPAEQDNSGATA